MAIGENGVPAACCDVLTGHRGTEERRDAKCSTITTLLDNPGETDGPGEADGVGLMEPVVAHRVIALGGVWGDVRRSVRRSYPLPKPATPRRCSETLQPNACKFAV